MGDGVLNDLDIPIGGAAMSAAPIQPVPIPQIANSYIGLYLQDDWRVTHNLPLNLGLRWDFDTDATGNSVAPTDTEGNTNSAPFSPWGARART